MARRKRKEPEIQGEDPVVAPDGEPTRTKSTIHGSTCDGPRYAVYVLDAHNSRKGYMVFERQLETENISDAKEQALQIYEETKNTVSVWDRSDIKEVFRHPS